MLKLIGIGLDHLNEVKKQAIVNELCECTQIFLDTYTNFISKETIKNLEQLGIKTAQREFVESEEILIRAQTENVALLVSGDPLFATTHHSLIIAAHNKKIRWKVIHNISVHTAALSISGLQCYRFGRTTTLTQDFLLSPFEFIKKNIENNLHSLVLADPSVNLNHIINNYIRASEELKLPREVIILSNLGTEKQFVRYSNIENFLPVKKELRPFCFIVPAKLHFMEKEFINSIHAQ